MQSRYLETPIRQDLTKKMVFIGGPRQCGKTTLAKTLLDQPGVYLNWDRDEDRQAIIKKQWSNKAPLVVFDELHKLPRWKTWLKGVYDTRTTSQQFLVTGSARLDVYRRGGDSLMGRYHYWRLHPLTLAESPKTLSSQVAFKRLMTVGGFPEPFLDGDVQEARRWRRERLDRVVREDIRDLELVRNLASLSLFIESLRHRVGSLIVLSNIAEELQVSPVTLKQWIEVLERMYLIFVVRPLTRQVLRAVHKPFKVYFFDNADVIGDEGAIYENLIATSLLKQLHYIEDSQGFRMQLHYIRDKDGREVDFAVTRDGMLEQLIEAKYSDHKISTALNYYAERLKPKSALQLVANLPRAYSKGKLEVTPAIDFLKTLV